VLTGSNAVLAVALSLLIAQGLPLDSADAIPALLLASAGGLLQAGFSICVTPCVSAPRLAPGSPPTGRSA